MEPLLDRGKKTKQKKEKKNKSSPTTVCGTAFADPPRRMPRFVVGAQ